MPSRARRVLVRGGQGSRCAGVPDPADPSGELGEPLAPRSPRTSGLERLDQLIVVTPARAWVALLALAVLLGGLIAWAALAQVRVTQDAPAAFIPGGALAQASAPVDGIVESVAVRPGEAIAAGATIAVIRDLDGRRTRVQSGDSGRILAALAAPGDTVTSGAVLAKIERRGAPRLRAFPSFEVAQQLAPGDVAVVTVSGTAGERTAFDARVVRIGRVPLDRSDVAALVGDSALARLLVGADETVTAVELAPDDRSDAMRLERRLRPALIADVTLVLGEQHPLSFVTS